MRAREGGQEQALEDQRVTDVGRCSQARDWHRAAVKDQVRVAAQHGHEHRVHLRQHARPRPGVQAAAQRRAARLFLRRLQAAPRCTLA